MQNIASLFHAVRLNTINVVSCAIDMPNLVDVHISERSVRGADMVGVNGCGCDDKLFVNATTAINSATNMTLWYS